MRPRVIVDGVKYAPVSESNPNAKQIATALIERYMGKFDESEWEKLANELQVCVSEDMDEPTVMQTVLEILAAMEPVKPSVDHVQWDPVGWKIVALGEDSSVLCEHPNGRRVRYWFGPEST